MTLEQTLILILVILIFLLLMGKIGREVLGEVIGLILILLISLLIIVTGLILSPFYAILKIWEKLVLTSADCKKDIVRCYDEIFFEATSKKQVKNALKRIQIYNELQSRRDQKRREKETKKFLKSVKWTL